MRTMLKNMICWFGNIRQAGKGTLAGLTASAGRDGFARLSLTQGRAMLATVTAFGSGCATSDTRSGGCDTVAALVFGTLLGLAAVLFVYAIIVLLLIKNGKDEDEN